MKLKVSAIFYSLQGEGSTMGEPAVFLRLQACNLNCSWCDTKYALGSGGKWMLVSNVLEEIKKYKCWHLVITGGEPLLQQKGIWELIKSLGYFRKIEIETNGTIKPMEYIEREENVRFNVSLKLSSSKNPDKLRLQPDVIEAFAKMPDGKVEWKFVIATKQDFEEMHDLLLKYCVDAFPLENVVVMPEGKTQKEIVEKCKWLVPLCRDFELRLLPRLQVMIWGKKRGV